MKFLEHMQITPATVWTINHNFRTKVTADCWIVVEGVKTKILPMKMKNVDDNTLTVHFSAPRSGGARLVADAA